MERNLIATPCGRRAQLPHSLTAVGQRAADRQGGFTLTELAIVLVIIALLTGGLLLSLSTQREIDQYQETQKILSSAREALLGFGAANGRLPCPATLASKGEEDVTAGDKDCNETADNNYFFPAVTLGLGPTDSQGYLVDPWNNRIRYQITDADDWAFAKNNDKGLKSIGMANLKPDLKICSTHACNNGTVLTDRAVAVIYSVGKNAATAPAGDEEKENLDADGTFVSRTFGPDGAGTFDDTLIWLSPNILYSKLISAGQLP